MSPVHVMVGEDPRAEAMWAEAFAGAIDLYRFPRNVDAFERLTVAEAPIDLVILTPAQRGPFNLTPDQFIARVLEGPLGTGRFLANLHVIVVGQSIERSHPRVMAVSTMDAAIRLVKFGEVERAPRPHAPELPIATRDEVRDAPRVDIDSLIGDSIFSDSVISSIWDAPRPAPRRDAGPGADVVGGGPARRQRPARPEPVAQVAAPIAAPIIEPQPVEPANPQLFSRTTAPGFIAAAVQAQPVMGGGEVAQVGAPSESIEVATGLQPSRAYELPNGAGYRGPALRAGQVHGALHVGQPVPPALASQVQSMVYGAQGAIVDPVMIWSSSAREQGGAGVGEAPQHGGIHAAVPVPVPMPAQVAAPAYAAQPAAPQPVRTVPMDPPAGAYNGGAAQPAQAVDPFLRRAEASGGDISFG